MTAALALHVAVHCVVPPGMSSRCMASRTRACRARAFAPHFTRHFARHSALLSDVPLIAPQAGDSLRIGVQPVVLSGVFALIQVPCRCTWRARAFARYAALHSAQPSKVQASCLEHAGPVALAAFAGALAAHAAAPPGRVESQSARGGGAARSGFAAVPLVARGPRQCSHVRVLRTTGYAGACRERSHDQPPR